MALTVLRRFIPLDGAFNLRDLGGYETADGRSVRWRTLFRADGMHRLTEPDLDLLRPLGLRTVIDLRSDAEVASGRFPVDVVPVDWYQLSVIDVLWDPEHAPADRAAFAEFLYHRYREMLDLGGPHFAEAIRRLAAPRARPGLFHCAAGKDRTGLLAALILSALGVGDDDVAADYALSQEALYRLRTWAAREHPELVTRIDEQPAAHLAAEPAAMRRVLQWIGDEHGSTRGYLGALAVGPDVVDALVAGLLE